MKRTWKNVELSKENAEKFRTFLKENGVRYEASGCFNLIHFELYVNDSETEMLNRFLDTL